MDEGTSGPMRHPFPVDDVTLAIVESACLPDGEDDPSTLSQVLTFESELVGTAGDIDYYMGGWHPNDVILALIAEVRRLRDGIHDA